MVKLPDPRLNAGEHTPETRQARMPIVGEKPKGPADNPLIRGGYLGKGRVAPLEKK